MKLKDIKRLSIILPDKNKMHLNGLYFLNNKCYATDGRLLIQYNLTDFEIDDKYFISNIVLKKFKDADIVFKRGKIFIYANGVEVMITNDERALSYPDVENLIRENENKKYKLVIDINILEKIVRLGKNFGIRFIEFYFDENNHIGKIMFNNERLKGLFVYEEFEKVDDL